MSLHNKAMLAKVSVHGWSGKKFDQKVTAEINQQHQASDNAGRYNKQLVPKSALQPIKTIEGKIRKTHIEQTLPWRDDGFRILPSANYLDYQQIIGDLLGEYHAACDKFCENYHEYVNAGRAELNGMFCENDYPLAEEIRTKFDCSMDVYPIPNTSDFRVEGVDQQELEEHKAKLAKDTALAEIGAQNEIWRRLFIQVSDIAERMADPDKAFKNVLIENLSKICDLAPRLNLQQDPELDGIAKEAKAKLCKDPDALRKVKPIREHVAQQAADIVDRMSAYMGGSHE